MPGLLRRFLDGRAPAQNDHVSQRNQLAVGTRKRVPGAVEVLLDLLQRLQHLPQLFGPLFGPFGGLNGVAAELQQRLAVFEAGENAC